jgi:hypothetical protein
MLSACASGQNLAQADLDQMTADLRAARESLGYSLANLDIMLGLVEQVGPKVGKLLWVATLFE